MVYQPLWVIQCQIRSEFSKAPASLEPQYQIVYCHIQDTCWWGSYVSAEVQSLYSTVPADWAMLYSHMQIHAERITTTQR